MNRNESWPEWMLFPSERKNSGVSSNAFVSVDKATLERIDDLVENSNGQSRAEILEDLVDAEWESKS